MKILYEDIVLRDYLPSDIEDEIRWTNHDNAWFFADTPWMSIERLDPDDFRCEMTEYLASMPEGDFVRHRLEIEVDGKHIGMVSSYYLDKSFNSMPWDSVDPNKSAGENNAIRAMGIEIFEKDFWCRGIGYKALTAFMDYYRRKLGEKCFALETWSGNVRMQRCAEKLGFVEVKRDKNAYTVKDKTYDAIVLKKEF